MFANVLTEYPGPEYPSTRLHPVLQDKDFRLITLLVFFLMLDISFCIRCVT